MRLGEQLETLESLNMSGILLPSLESGCVFESGAANVVGAVERTLPFG